MAALPDLQIGERLHDRSVVPRARVMLQGPPRAGIRGRRSSGGGEETGAASISGFAGHASGRTGGGSYAPPGHRSSRPRERVNTAPLSATLQRSAEMDHFCSRESDHPKIGGIGGGALPCFARQRSELCVAAPGPVRGWPPSRLYEPKRPNERSCRVAFGVAATTCSSVFDESLMYGGGIAASLEERADPGPLASGRACVASGGGCWGRSGVRSR